MREGTGSRRRPSARSTRAHRLSVHVGLTAAALVLGACAGDASEPASDPGESGSPSSAETSESLTVSPSPTASPTPDKPREPRFRDNRAGKRAFVKYIIDGWGYALQTNDPSVLLDASGRKPCRGCVPLRRELRQRAKDEWYVDFPGARLRKVTFRADGPVEVATAIAGIPESQSFFEDGTVRNDNKARKRVRFVLDIRPDGQGKRRHWTLLAFSVK
jgi:hypothetical protein